VPDAFEEAETTMASRENIIADWRDQIEVVKRGCPETVKLTVAVFLATVWREFLNEHGSLTSFARNPKDQQFDYVERCKRKVSFCEEHIENLRSSQARDAHLVDAAAHYTAAAFVMYFFLATAMDDFDWEHELATELDELLICGWGMSWGGMRLSGDERHFPLENPMQPIEMFTRK
jgi:hypothetical protein